MTTRALIAIIILNVLCLAAAAQTTLRSNAHIGFAYPLSTNGSHAAEYTNAFSLHALIGVSRCERTFCASGLASIIKDTAYGLAAGGLLNIIGKDARGAQLAGFMNYVGLSQQGIIAAGFINVTGTTNGASAAGFANINSGDANGAQLAGFINKSKKANTQMAGFINIATDVKGAQIAGFANIAKKVKGVQAAGFINIADSNDFPIGIINIIGNGEKSLGITADETGNMLATFRSGGRVLYGIIGIGYNSSYSLAQALQAGFGAHVTISRNFRLNTEISSTWIYDFMGNSDLRSGIRCLPALRLGSIELFAGPSFNYTTSADIQGIGKTGYSLWSDHNSNRSHDFSLGIEGGAQFHLENLIRKSGTQK